MSRPPRFLPALVSVLLSAGGGGARIDLPVAPARHVDARPQGPLRFDADCLGHAVPVRTGR